MARSCICYIADRTYLFPSLLSAIQARKHTSSDLADVRIFLTTPDDDMESAFGAACEREGIHLHQVPASVHQALDQIRQERPDDIAGRISVTAFGRLFISQMLKKAYDDFLYIDGDTQVVESLDPLLLYDLPPGKIMAARDYTGLLRDTGRTWLRDADLNMDRMNIPPEQRSNYFNTGVIRSSVEGWQEVGLRALEYYLATPGLEYHDQDALNGTMSENHILISSRWNYPKQLLGMRMRQLIQPAIIHYMGQPKPWHGNYAPWNDDAVQPYRDMLAAYPALRPYCPRLPLGREFAYKFKAKLDSQRNSLRGTERDSVVRRLLDPAVAI